MSSFHESSGRRGFLAQMGLLAGAVVLCTPALAFAAKAKGETNPMEITPTEDLMQEHGVLRRLLLIYDEIIVRLKAGKGFPLPVLTSANDLIKRFIQDYHEKDEEEYLFSRFEKAGKLTDLVKVLSAQHQAGRKLTAQLQIVSVAGNLNQPEQRHKIASLLTMFTRMYRPHAAREDTVLYPAFRSLIPAKEMEKLGDVFEDKEQKLFGKGGFEKIVAQVAGLEQQLGIYELSRFTPQIPGA